MSQRLTWESVNRVDKREKREIHFTVCFLWHKGKYWHEWNPFWKYNHSNKRAFRLLIGSTFFLTFYHLKNNRNLHEMDGKLS